jgi:lipopolysaccharide/colanic/teichoic acid biosynthesis glycosyltransferase
MIQKGYGSLAKKRTVLDESDRSSKTLDPREVSWHLEPTRHGNLHVVTAERRNPSRVQVADYTAEPASDDRFYYLCKRGFDLIGATLLILLFSPLIIAIVAYAQVSGGSALFVHRRVGQGGIFFNCLKFRTMVPDADQVLQDLLDSDREIKEEWIRDHKLRDDPRVTRLGRFLRKSSLDELPQLWNVLRGEMSLVGPRPVVPEELRRYGKRVHTFLSARPGITGLWQISGRNDTDYRKRVALDVCYVHSRSLILDIYILLKTMPVVFARSGAY